MVPNTFNNFNARRGALGFAEFTVIQLAVAASQVILPGDILALSSGKVQQSIAAPAANSVTLSGGNLAIVGVAVTPFTADSSGNYVAGGVTQTTTLVAQANDDLNVCYLFLGVSGNTSGTTTPAALVFGSTLGLLSEVQDVTIGQAYQFGRFTNNASGSWYFISGVTTNGEIRVSDINPLIAPVATNEYPPVWGKFINSVRQLG